MKLVPRIFATVLVLISTTAFAQIELNSNVAIGANGGAGDNVFVQLFGQGVFIGAMGGTPPGFFDVQPYFPGDSALGPTMVFWDSAGLQIGSTGYNFDQFDLFPTSIDIPSITFPTNGKDFTVRVPFFVWELDGTILQGGNDNTTCPSSGCDFSFVSRPGTLSFSFTFVPDVLNGAGAYFPGPASFSTPEPGTLGLMVAGLAGILGVFKRRNRPALSELKGYPSQS